MTSDDWKAAFHLRSRLEGEDKRLVRKMLTRIEQLERQVKRIRSDLITYSWSIDVSAAMKQGDDQT